MNVPIRVVAAVIVRNEKVLICRRPLTKRHGGLWEFPGGKCEPGEGDEDTLRRELAEELGVSVGFVDEPMFSTTDPGSEYLIVFRRTEIEGEPQPTEHTDMRWVALADVNLATLAPSDRRLVERAIGSGRQ